MMNKHTLKTDEITSTEKLLNLIRGRSDQMPDDGATPRVKKDPSDKKKKRVPEKGSSEFKNATVSVGVDIGQDCLRLVKAVRSGGKWRLAERRSVKLPPGVEKESGAFDDFLRATLVSVCGDNEKTDIWTVMSSAQVEVRQIRIPKVPEAQIEQVVYWTLKKEASFDEKEFFFDYEILGETDEAGARKLGLLCYTVPIEQVENIKSLFSRTGVALTGISIVPFFVQNIFKTRWMVTGKYTACLFIGNEYSRIDLFVDGRMALTRDIKTGINSMVEMIAEVLHTRLGDGGQPDHEKARKLLFALGHGGDDLLVLDDGRSIGREEVASLIVPVLERLVRQMERTFDHYSTNLGYERIGEVYLASVMPVSQTTVSYFQKQLGIESRIFDPIGSAMAEEDLDERVAFIPSFGMALSDIAYTPNFIFTYKDKKKKAAVERLNRIIFAALIAIVLACSGIFADQLISASRQRNELVRLEQQASKASAVPNRDLVLGLVSQKKEQRQKLKMLSERYVGMAILSELSSATPVAVSLTSVRYSSGESVVKGPEAANAKRAARGPEAAKKSKGEDTGTVLIEGTIRGERSRLDTLLATFVMKLNASPLFREVTVAKSGSGGNGLVFTLNARMVR